MGEGMSPEISSKSDKKKETKDKKSVVYGNMYIIIKQKYQYKGIIRSYPNFRGGNPYIHNQNMWSPPAWQETKYDHRKTEDLIEFNRSHYPTEYDDNRATFKPRISVLNPEIFRPVDVAERENEDDNNNSDSYNDEEDEENNYINNSNNNDENNSYSGSRSVSEDSIEL